MPRGPTAKHADTTAASRLAPARAWLAADRVTLADGMLFISLDFARMVRFKPSEDLANLARWREAMVG